MAARVHFFTGKGGVGKSTLTAAMAIACAKEGKRPLVVELAHRASMLPIFGVSEVGYKEVSVGDGVSAMTMSLQPSLADYLKSHLKVASVAKRLSKSQTLNRFFQAAPAVSEVAMLHKLELLRESGKYDTILVDLDATGHAMMFLSLPEVFETLSTDGGPLRKLLASFVALLSDPTQSQLHFVTTCEELPINETRELNQMLIEKGHVSLGNIFFNRVPRLPFERSFIEAIEKAEGPDAELAMRLIRKEARSSKRVSELVSATKRPFVMLPSLELESARDVAFAIADILVADGKVSA